MLTLFLDDDDSRAALAYQRWPTEKRNNTLWVKTVPEVIETLESYDNISEVNLDHDLGGEIYVDSRREDCGMEVVRYIERDVKKNGIDRWKSIKFVVHTHNYKAGYVMTFRLERLGLNAKYVPFGY